MTRARVARRVAVVVGGAVLAALLVPAAQASAHAVFVSADPQPGAALRTPPAAVRIVFSEPLDHALSGIDVYASSGRRIPARPASAGDARGYAIALPALRPDRYAVVWHTVSAIDGHSRRGSYSFTVDRQDGSRATVAAAARLPASGDAPPAAAPAAATWVGLAGLFLMLGALLIAARGAGAGIGSVPPGARWLRRLLVAGGAGLVLGAVGELVSSWAATGWQSLDDLLTTSAGHWWEVRVAAAAVVLVLERASGAVIRLLQLACAGLAGYSFAATSHGAAAAHSSAGLAFEFVHILAAAVWLGGASALAVVWLLVRGSASVDRRRLLRRYSLTAGVAVPVLLASGLGNAVLQLGAVGDLVTSSYGIALLIKLIAVAALLVVAAINAALIRPAHEGGRPRGRRLSRTIALEAALGLAVLLPTATLASLAPARPADAARTVAHRLQAESDPATAFAGSTMVGGQEAEISVTPGTVGVNAVRVELTGASAAARLVLKLAGPGHASSVELHRTGLDHDPETHTIYAGAVQLDRAGSWRMALGSGTAPPIVLPVTAGAAEPGGPAGSWLALIAVGGAAAALVGAARFVPRGRRRAGVRAVGALGIAAAVAWGATVAAAVPRTPHKRQDGWGSPRVVRPAALAYGAVWRLPTADAGVMMPAVAPDGGLWVAEMSGNKLARLDPVTDVVREFEFPGGYRETMGVAVAGDGRVWLAQEHAMALGVFDPRAGSYREFRIPGGVSAPVGIAVDPHGAVWFTEMSGNKIGRFDPVTAHVTQYPIPTVDAAPYWLALAPDGRVWFTEFGVGRVGVLDPATGRIREYPLPGHPDVPGIAVGRDGTVWVTSIQGALYGLTPGTGRLRHIALPAGADYGVAVGREGTVWVGRDGGRALYAVDPATTRVRTVLMPLGSAPWWPVVDGRGHVWVALAGSGGNQLAELVGAS